MTHDVRRLAEESSRIGHTRCYPASTAEGHYYCGGCGDQFFTHKTGDEKTRPADYLCRFCAKDGVTLDQAKRDKPWLWREDA